MRSVRGNALEGADEGATERRSTQASTNLQHDAIHNLMAKAEAVALDNDRKLRTPTIRSPPPVAAPSCSRARKIDSRIDASECDI